MDVQELLEAWRTNHRINLHLIESISEEGLRSTLSTRGGRDVSQQFAHLHNVRRYHLEKRAKDLVGDLRKFETADRPSREELVDAHTASTEAIATFLADVLAGVEKRRGFKKGLFTTLSYFVAHDSHHRGNILLTLKQSGHAVPKDVRYGLWAWDQR